MVCVDLDVTGFYSSKAGPSSQHTLLGLLLKERKTDWQDKSSPSPNFACSLRRLGTWVPVLLHFSRDGSVTIIAEEQEWD